MLSIEVVNDWLTPQCYATIPLHHKIFHRQSERKSCLVYASLTDQRFITQMGRGFHLPHMWQYYLRDLVYDEIQEDGTGKSNPVAHGDRTVRRNYYARWGHRRSLG